MLRLWLCALVVATVRGWSMGGLTGVPGRHLGAARGGALMMSKSRRGEAQIEDFRDAMYKKNEYMADVPPLEEDPGLAEVYTVVRAADLRKAQNINALRVSHLTVVTNFMVVLEGTSRPQNQAIAASIIEAMEEEHGRLTKQEGTPDSGWILLDYGDIIIHIMTPKSRAYYDLESFWREGERVELEHVLVPNAPPGASAAATGARAASFLDEDDEEDPFWS